MARKRHHEEHANHEAWAIPYGDLITLLLALFVVMYAMSSVNEGKYRILSDSLLAAFRGPPKSMQPIQVGNPSKSTSSNQIERPRVLAPLEVDASQHVVLPEDLRNTDPAFIPDAGFYSGDLEEAAQLIEQISNSIETQLETLVKQDLVRLRRNRFWVEIEINTSVLFTSGSAAVSAEALPIVSRLSGILAGTPTRIQVEGYTDNQPISTVAYPSNWELVRRSRRQRGAPVHGQRGRARPYGRGGFRRVSSHRRQCHPRRVVGRTGA